MSKITLKSTNQEVTLAGGKTSVGYVNVFIPTNRKGMEGTPQTHVQTVRRSQLVFEKD